ncbi:hypothetical protein JL720_13014 [Aureococcus anophagefferens]|nr:hypothetical protein JL720_13014 [Aureococcus anophagefferens]
MVPDLEDGEDVVEKKKKAKVINYASMDAGAVVLEQSEHSKGFHKLLLDDKDKCGITECSEKKMVVIGLSEDIQMRELILCQYEKYSSGVRDFDNFTMAEFKYVRYLKLRFLTHHGDEASCTVSQIKVHGVAVTVMEGFQDDLQRHHDELEQQQALIETDDLVLPEPEEVLIVPPPPAEPADGGAEDDGAPTRRGARGQRHGRGRGRGAGRHRRHRARAPRGAGARGAPDDGGAPPPTLTDALAAPGGDDDAPAAPGDAGDDGAVAPADADTRTMGKKASERVAAVAESADAGASGAGDDDRGAGGDSARGAGGQRDDDDGRRAAGAERDARAAGRTPRRRGAAAAAERDRGDDDGGGRRDTDDDDGRRRRRRRRGRGERDRAANATARRRATALCHEALDFKKFKAQMKLKVQSNTTQLAKVASGSQFESVFKTLMDKIKAFEINHAIYELYLGHLQACYAAQVDRLERKVDDGLAALRASSRTSRRRGAASASWQRRRTEPPRR